MLTSKLEILKLQAEQSKLWANYWIAFAKSPANYARKLQKVGPNDDSKGMIEWIDMSNDEKEIEAMETAKTHILRHQEIIDMFWGEAN